MARWASVRVVVVRSCLLWAVCWLHLTPNWGYRGMVLWRGLVDEGCEEASRLSDSSATILYPGGAWTRLSHPRPRGETARGARLANWGHYLQVGAAATLGYAGVQHDTAVIPAIAITGGLGAAVVVGGISGLLPAIRAARLDPTESLRSM
jgi:hypothetical protein